MRSSRVGALVAIKAAEFDSVMCCRQQEDFFRGGDILGPVRPHLLPQLQGHPVPVRAIRAVSAGQQRLYCTGNA